MATRAAPQGDSLLDAEIGISEDSLTCWRERVLSWQRTDLDRALARFTFVADVTTLAGDCRFAGDGDTLVARYDGLPFTAVAFCSRDETSNLDSATGRVSALTRRLVPRGESFTCLVSEPDWQLARAAYHVIEAQSEWQMVFRGRPNELDSGDAVPLRGCDLLQMRALASREGMQAFERNPLALGPWYGVWRGGTLVAQGGTHLLLDRAAEIGNVVTARDHRRRGCGSQVVAALVRELAEEGYSMFLQVLKRNKSAMNFYEALGFRRHRRMILARCRIRGGKYLDPQAGPVAGSATDEVSRRIG